jgi:hypothetical protein
LIGATERSVKINQINFSYVPLEDRLLFKVNTTDKTECRMWLTRAMSLRLSNLLGEAVKIGLRHKQPGLAQSTIEAMEDFRREAVLARTDYKTTFTSEGASFPLGQQPILVADIILDNSAEIPAISFQLATGQRIALSVDHDLGLAVSKLLSDVLNKSTDWGIGSAQDQVTDETKAKTTATLMH